MNTNSAVFSTPRLNVPLAGCGAISSESGITIDRGIEGIAEQWFS
jgi:hypothetical protein